jgi:hypothetical protein
MSCSWRWGETMSLNCVHKRAYCSSSKQYMSTESPGGMILTGKTQKKWRKTCHSATMSTTDPTYTDLGANPDLRGESPTTNHLSNGMALTRA